MLSYEKALQMTAKHMISLHLFGNNDTNFSRETSGRNCELRFDTGPCDFYIFSTNVAR